MRKAEKITWTEKVAHAGLILKQQDLHSGTAFASFVSRVGTLLSGACDLESSSGTASPGMDVFLGIVPRSNIIASHGNRRPVFLVDDSEGLATSKDEP